MNVHTVFPSRGYKSSSVLVHVFIVHLLTLRLNYLWWVCYCEHKGVEQTESQGKKTAFTGLHKHKQHNLYVGFPDNIKLNQGHDPVSA